MFMIQFGEYRFRVHPPSFSIFDVLLYIEPFFRFLSILSQTVVDLNDQFAVIYTPHWAAFSSSPGNGLSATQKRMT